MACKGVTPVRETNAAAEDGAVLQPEAAVSQCSDMLRNMGAHLLQRGSGADEQSANNVVALKVT
jgi:hypothetical protein